MMSEDNDGQGNDTEKSEDVVKEIGADSKKGKAKKKGEKKGEKKAAKTRKVEKIFGANQRAAGAGVVGLIGFFGLFVIASIFFITENYFLAMFIMSIGLMVYVTGLDLVKVLLSSFTIFFSSKHLIAKAVFLQETLQALNRVYRLKRGGEAAKQTPSVAVGAAVTLPDNSLTQDIKSLVDDGKEFDYAEYIAHSYYVECHELYDYSNANLEFVANAMPLFGLIGTILGLIAMFDGLGANVTVESLTPQLALALKTTLYGAIFSSIYKIISSRFDQRLKALEYDYETFCRALEVMIRNKNVIEVEG
jgi:biopolymer transport protein ExbB/TolQ